MKLRGGCPMDIDGDGGTRDAADDREPDGEELDYLRFLPGEDLDLDTDAEVDDKTTSMEPPERADARMSDSVQEMNNHDAMLAEDPNQPSVLRRVRDDAKSRLFHGAPVHCVSVGPLLENDDDADDFLDYDDAPNKTRLLRKMVGRCWCTLSSPKPRIVVAGDQRHRACLWESGFGCVMVNLEAHNETIASCGFSPDGSRVATGDLAGNIFLWPTNDDSGELAVALNREKDLEDGLPEDPQPITHTFVNRQPVRLEGMHEVVWMQWHPKGPIIAAGDCDGTTWVWNANTATCTSVLGFVRSECTCGTWSYDGRNLITAYQSGEVAVWRIRSGQVIHRFSNDTYNPKRMLRFASNGIVSIASHHSKPLFLTGSQDGDVFLCNSENGEVHEKLPKHQGSVEFVGFCQKAQSWAVTCGTDGQAFVWDIDHKSVIAVLEHPSQISSAALRQIRHYDNFTQDYLYTGAADGHVRVWDIANGRLLHDLIGFEDSVWCISVSSDGHVIVAGSEDGTSAAFDPSKSSLAREHMHDQHAEPPEPLGL